MSRPTQPSLFLQALKGGILIAFLLTPLVITIMVMSGYRFWDFGPQEAQGPGPEIRCIDENKCILRVRGKWYIVTDVLEETEVPEKFVIDKFVIDLDNVVVEDTLGTEEVTE